MAAIQLLAGVWIPSPAILLVVAVIAIVLLPWAINRWKYRHIPGPFAPPFLGNLGPLATMGLHEYVDACATKYGKIFKMYTGSNMMIVVADPEIAKRINYRLLNRDIGRQLLTGRNEDDLGTQGLVAAKDGMWRTLRLAWQPAFQSGSLEGYSSLMDSCAIKLADKLEAAAAAGQVVNIWRELGKMTMAVVGTTAYGVDFQTLDAEGSKTETPGSDAGRRLVEASATVFSMGTLSGGSIYMLMLLMFPKLLPMWRFLAKSLPDKRLRILIKARNMIRDTSLHLVAAWQAQHPAANGTAAPGAPPKAAPAGADSTDAPDAPDKAQPTFASLEDILGSGAAVTSKGATLNAAGELVVNSAGKAHGANGAHAAAINGRAATDSPPRPATAVKRGGKAGSGILPGSFLGLLLEARDRDTGAQLTDSAILAQSNTFILAGYETTANTLAFSIYNIGAHERVQQRLLQEIDDFGRSRNVTHADLDRFPYAEAIVKEALRLFPPATVLNREVKGPGPFEIAPGILAPPNKALFTALYSYQRSKDYWPAALEFRPERFLPEGAAVLGPKIPEAYTPFGAGPRMCVGWRFALQEAKIALVRLYQRYTFELAPGQVPLQVQQNLTLSPKEGVFVVPRLRGQCDAPVGAAQ